MNSPEPHSVDDSATQPVSLQAIGQAPLLPPREPLGARIAGSLGRHHSLLIAVCVLLLWAIVAMPPLWNRDPYQPGSVSGHDVLVPQPAYLLDHEETRRRQEEAANLVTPYYDPNAGAPSLAISHLASLCDSARELAPSSPALPDAARLRGWRARLHLPRKKVGDAALTAIVQIPGARWNAVENVARGAVTAVYKNGQLRSDVLAAENSSDLAAARVVILAFTRRAQQSGSREPVLMANEALAASALAEFVVGMHPNQVVNGAKTRRAREAAGEGVPEVYQRYHADDVLLRANEIITERKWAQMQELGIVTPKISLKVALARLALVVMLVCFGAAYLKHFHPRLMNQPAALWLAGMVPIAFALAFRLLLRVPHSEYLMVPLAATGAMLLTILLNARVGVMGGFVLAAVCSVMARVDATWLLAAALTSWIGALSVADISSRAQVVRAGVVLAATNAVLIAAIGFLGDLPLKEIISTSSWEAFAGVASVALMAGMATFLERPFGITTHLRLLDLLSPDETVMRRMQAEAPGTFTHSFMVAMLSEAGGKAVGADALLCRVGGLYHDIGKLRRPHCFIENQSGHNIHDELSPQLSALIILAHVKDGLELGRALRLPLPVLDIIAQHHGTSVLTYFYNRALQGAQSATIPAADVAFGEVEAPSAIGSPDITMFRYAGPRPQGKEAAIVLLADSIEASSRALPDVTPEKLREHIRAMIALRLQEGELSECELTLRDLGIIENAFTHVLRGALHQRIQYPGASRELEANSDWLSNGVPNERRAVKREVKSERGTQNEVARPENSPANEKERSGGRRRRRRGRKNEAKTDSAALTPVENLHESKTRPNLETSREERNHERAPGQNGSANQRENTSQRESESTSKSENQRQLESGSAPSREEFHAGGHLPGTFSDGAPGGEGDLAKRAAAIPDATRRR